MNNNYTETGRLTTRVGPWALRAFAAAVSCFLALPASGQIQIAPTDSEKPATPERAPANTDLSQDKQFLALLTARDNKLTIIGELRRIIAYHDNFKTRLDAQLGAYSTTNSNRALRATALINRELSRLAKFEQTYKQTSDPKKKLELVDDFDGQFPIDLTISTRLPDDRTTFAQRERPSANEVFQNVSLDNREWLTRYDKLFSTIDAALKILEIKAPSLDALPGQFNSLADAESTREMNDAQVQLAIDKYRTALNEARTAIGALRPSSTVDTAKKQIGPAIDLIEQDIVKRLADATSELRELEKTMSAQAKSLYGGKVGAESFNYLLAVFAAVFLVLMAAPKLYAQAVAENILKSEFILQFSTVFVLIAAIIILGIGNLIDKQQLPVLLAGISGYVLGQLGKS